MRKRSNKKDERIAKIADDRDVILVYENCSGWGGLSIKNMLKFHQDVNSPNFKIFMIQGMFFIPNKGVDPWEFFTKVKPYTEYVYIKDYKTLENGKEKAKYPGEEEAKVKEVSKNLKKSGYNGFISIGPHLASVVNEGKVGDPEIT